MPEPSSSEPSQWALAVRTVAMLTLPYDDLNDVDCVSGTRTVVGRWSASLDPYCQRPS